MSRLSSGSAIAAEVFLALKMPKRAIFASNHGFSSLNRQSIWRFKLECLP
jgi:hypothetical protein